MQDHCFLSITSLGFPLQTQKDQDASSLNKSHLVRLISFFRCGFMLVDCTSGALGIMSVEDVGQKSEACSGVSVIGIREMKPKFCWFSFKVST